MLLSDFIKQSVAVLESLYPHEESLSIVNLLISQRLGVSRYLHITEPTTTIEEGQLPLLQQDMQRLMRSEPIQYILGHSEFYGRRFAVCPDVLIPRQETEILVQEAVNAARRAMQRDHKYRILDLCTGSGCIAWSVALELPDAEIIALDISEPALNVAKEQYRSLGVPLSLSPKFLSADVLDVEHIPELGEFDMILSNPPYIVDSERDAMSDNVLEYEPHLALFVPDDDALRFYSAIAKWAARLLREGGVGIFEINNLYSDALLSLYKAEGFDKVEALSDLYGRSRFIKIHRAKE